MTKISAYEAKTHFSALLERVAKGESIVITKHGHEVAKLSPIQTTLTSAEAVEKIIELSKGKSLGNLSIRELIEEGRR
jgi:prevent-host-death family protein